MPWALPQHRRAAPLAPSLPVSGRAQPALGAALPEDQLGRLLPRLRTVSSRLWLLPPNYRFLQKGTDVQVSGEAWLSPALGLGPLLRAAVQRGPERLISRGTPWPCGSWAGAPGSPLSASVLATHGTAATWHNCCVDEGRYGQKENSSHPILRTR